MCHSVRRPNYYLPTLTELEGETLDFDSLASSEEHYRPAHTQDRNPSPPSQEGCGPTERLVHTNIYLRLTYCPSEFLLSYCRSSTSIASTKIPVSCPRRASVIAGLFISCSLPPKKKDAPRKHKGKVHPGPSSSLSLSSSPSASYGGAMGTVRPTSLSRKKASTASVARSSSKIFLTDELLGYFHPHAFQSPSTSFVPAGYTCT